MSSGQSINIVMEGEQRSLLVGAGGNAMPLLERNLETGWPLLSIGIYDFEDADSIVPAIGGMGMGACHHMALGLYGFAQMLARLPGRKKIHCGYENELITSEPIHLDLTACVHRYSIQMQSCDIIVSERMGGYGKMTMLTIGEFEEAELLYQALRKVHSVFMPNVSVEGDIYAESSASQMLEGSLREGAIFYNAHVWVDFGYFLNRFQISPDLITLFKTLFKPDEFLRDMRPQILAKRQPDLGSSAESEVMSLSSADALLHAAACSNRDAPLSATTCAVGMRVGSFNEAEKENRIAATPKCTVTAWIAECTVPALLFEYTQVSRRQSLGCLEDKVSRMPSGRPDSQKKRRRLFST